MIYDLTYINDEHESDEETKEEESFDPIPQTSESSKDEGDGEEDQGFNIGEEERHIEEEEEDELYRDARPTKKHAHAVKRIFRYLRGTVHRGLWYSKDSSVSLIAFVDADHAGC
nr:uncharacterized mitochondrial protein AtMg00810-like [Tanacetum cinerariifolium]